MSYPFLLSFSEYGKYNNIMKKNTPVWLTLSAYVGDVSTADK